MLDSFRTRRLDFWPQGHSETSERAGALSAATQIQEGSDPDSGSQRPRFRIAATQIQDPSNSGHRETQGPKFKTHVAKFRHKGPNCPNARRRSSKSGHSATQIQERWGPNSETQWIRGPVSRHRGPNAGHSHLISRQRGPSPRGRAQF